MYLRLINNFYSISGLKINISKTQITWIGSKKYSDEKLCPDIDLRWTTQFNLLGFIYDVDLSKIIMLNYDKKLVKIKSIKNMWKKRKITPIGKVCIVKTLLILKLNHLFISLPTQTRKNVEKT